ncbi:MAG TPA: cupredoxin family copper-binding protein [Longimicrobiaceae bacterium]|nr:cupredoxin family copper-binding protein [Longimicrobiaceae bacterium]
MAAMLRSVACAAALVVALGAPLVAQTTLERTPLLSGGWIGLPGSLQINTPFRFSDAGEPGLGVLVVPTFEATLGLPLWLAAGARYAPQSQIARGHADEWELFGRYQPFGQARGAPLDVAVQAGYSGAAESLDGELSLARWFGGVRLLGAARLFTDAHGTGDTRGALAAGAVVHPLPRSRPVAVAGDVATVLDRGEGEKWAWSAALEVGIPYTVNTVSLFATNTASGTLQGTSLGVSRTRWGFELTLPIPLGSFLGWYPPREAAARAVQPVPAGAPAEARLFRASIYRYSFVEERIVVPAGTTVEWTNGDAVVHTVSADDASFNSGAIAPGGTWRATFTRPGTYAYHCGPHAFMKGVVIVRPG